MGGIEGVEPQSSEEMGDNKHITTVKWQDSDGNWHYALEVSPTSNPSGSSGSSGSGGSGSSTPTQLIAVQPFSETGNDDKEFTGTMNGLFIINDDSSASLTFTTNATVPFVLTLKAGESFEEGLEPFTSVNIVGTGAYRGYGLQQVS